MLEAENLSYFHDIVTDAFLFDWVPWLESAVLSYEAIYSLHPGMQCTRKTLRGNTRISTPCVWGTQTADPISLLDLSAAHTSDDGDLKVVTL